MIPEWWDCPECEQGSNLDADNCQDCGFCRWDHPNPDALLRSFDAPNG